MDCNTRSRAWTSPASSGQTGLGVRKPAGREARPGRRCRASPIGGVALFGRPSASKCAGAPLKWRSSPTTRCADVARAAGRGLIYNAHNRVLFSVPIVAEKVACSIGNGIAAQLRARAAGDRHRPQGARPSARRARPEGAAIRLHQRRAADAARRRCRRNPLRWRMDVALGGWIEVDRATLRHSRFTEVAAGRRCRRGAEKGKTASEREMAGAGRGRPSGQRGHGLEPTRYNGYTSCPLITRIGRAMPWSSSTSRTSLQPSFPGVIAPLKSWITWMMKRSSR